MSAWGSGSFENDNALDWVYDLQSYDDLDFIVSTLEQANDHEFIRYGQGHVTTYTVDAAIAAAEVVAALCGRPSEVLPPALTKWIQSHSLPVDTNTIELAIRIVTRALNTHELRNLWGEQTDYDEWKRVVEGLILRLQT